MDYVCGARWSMCGDKQGLDVTDDESTMRSLVRAQRPEGADALIDCVAAPTPGGRPARCVASAEAHVLREQRAVLGPAVLVPDHE